MRTASPSLEIRPRRFLPKIRLPKISVGSPPYIQAIKDLKEKGLTGWYVVKDFITRRISPLKKRVHLMWRYSGPQDPTRDYEEGK